MFNSDYCIFQQNLSYHITKYRHRLLLQFLSQSVKTIFEITEVRFISSFNFHTQTCKLRQLEKLLNLNSYMNEALKELIQK